MLLTLMTNLLLVWFRRELGLNQLGLKRFIRDVLKTPGFVTRRRTGLSVNVIPESPYFQQLNEWQSRLPLPLFSSQLGGILYKT